MQKDEARRLLVKYQAAQCTEAEKALVESWYAQLNEHEMDIPPETVQKWGEEIYNKLPGNEQGTKGNRLWPLAIAASMTIAVAIGLYHNYSKEINTTASRNTHDITPGRNQATLILANGKLVNLSNTKTGVIISANKVTYNDGTNVTNATDHEGTQTINTPKGGQYQVVLSDGSKVWLNAGTTLKFPHSFVGSANRKVELSGEAYFEVVRDKKHSFIVKSKQQELVVLGTHFNISAYEDEAATKSTLLEGSINIDGNTILQPGEQSTKTETSIRVEQTDTDIAVAWKNGEFMFRKEPLESIMRKITRWYDVEIIYTDKQQGAKLFGGAISRFANVSEVLNMLQLTGQVHFKIEGRRIMVLK